MSVYTFIKRLPTDLTCYVFMFLESGCDNKKQFPRVLQELEKEQLCESLQTRFKYCKNAYIDYDDHFFYINFTAGTILNDTIKIIFCKF